MRWKSAFFSGVVLCASAASGAGCSKASADSLPDAAPLFASTCARCHGPDGKGGPPTGPGQPAPRNLTDPAFQAARSDAELRAVITGGKGGVMPAFGAVYSAEQIDALVAHVRRLGGK